jgi:uncharacterized repeat protein (TIGR03803 family)
LLYAGGALYGTASEGGALGLGSIFRISFPPSLFITRIGTNAVLTWPSNAVGFNLETTTNLTGAWDPLAGQYSVTNPISGRQKFLSAEVALAGTMQLVLGSARVPRAIDGVSPSVSLNHSVHFSVQLKDAWESRRFDG